MQRRQYYRVQYPPTDRPTIVFEDQVHPVLDIAETGIKYEHSGSALPQLGHHLTATVVFADKERVEVEGLVLRITGSEVIVRLDRWVPFAKIMSEQRRFLKASPAA